MVFDLDQAECLVCNILSVGSNGSDFIMFAPDLVLQRHVVTDKAEPEALGILSCQYAVYPGQVLGIGGVYADDLCMGAAGMKYFPDQHLGQDHVVDVACLARCLVRRVRLCHTRPDERCLFYSGR